MKCGRRSSLFGHTDDEDRWLSDDTCSYCGSISPDELFKAIREGSDIGPTDKDYKIYVGGHRKFYFQHLSVDEQKLFIDLFNDKTMKIGVPGYFYQMPFFMTFKEPERL